MNPIRIIFFDIDGTLVDPQTGRISDKTTETVHRLQANGIKCGVVTGRPPASLPDFSGLRFDVVATFNGCFCCADTQTIYSNPIDPADIPVILANAKALGRPVSVAVKDRLSANGWDEDLADYYKLAGVRLTVDADFEKVLEEDIYQIMLGCRKQDHASIIQGARNVKLTFSWDRAADVIPASGGKGAAIRHILAYFGFDRSESLAFGDGFNDVEMFREVGAGIAMGNGAPELKAVATAVCGHVHDDGIYRFCLENGLI